MTDKLKVAIRTIPDVDDFTAMQCLAVALVELLKEQNLTSVDLGGSNFRVTVKIKKGGAK